MYRCSPSVYSVQVVVAKPPLHQCLVFICHRMRFENRHAHLQLVQHFIWLSESRQNVYVGMAPTRNMQYLSKSRITSYILMVYIVLVSYTYKQLFSLRVQEQQYSTLQHPGQTSSDPLLHPDQTYSKLVRLLIKYTHNTWTFNTMLFATIKFTLCTYLYVCNEGKNHGVNQTQIDATCGKNLNNILLCIWYVNHYYVVNTDEVHMSPAILSWECDQFHIIHDLS